jgi:hypothetical protein
MVRTRLRGQSVVEFGIIAILFTLIMFAIADFGLLLNDWLSVSSGARLLARDAAVGMDQGHLWNEAHALAIPGVTPDPYFTAPDPYCCTYGTPGSALQVRITYWIQCTPGAAACFPVTDPATLKTGYQSTDPTTGSLVTGTCTSSCAHPAPPSAFGTCAGGGVACPGDSVSITLTAAGAQVITPLVRPFFSGPSCASNRQPCYVPLSSTVTLRFEGQPQ